MISLLRVINTNDLKEKYKQEKQTQKVNCKKARRKLKKKTSSFTFVYIQKVRKIKEYRWKSKSMWFEEKKLLAGGFFYHFQRETNSSPLRRT